MVPFTIFGMGWRHPKITMKFHKEKKKLSKHCVKKTLPALTLKNSRDKVNTCEQALAGRYEVNHGKSNWD